MKQMTSKWFCKMTKHISNPRRKSIRCAQLCRHVLDGLSRTGSDKMAVNEKEMPCHFAIDIHSLKLTAKAPKNKPGPKRKLVFQPSIFRCKLLVSGRVYSMIYVDISIYLYICRYIYIKIYIYIPSREEVVLISQRRWKGDNIDSKELEGPYVSCQEGISGNHQSGQIINYFTNLDFPETRGFPFQNATF